MSTKPKADTINNGYRIVCTLALLFITSLKVHSQCNGVTFGNSYVATPPQITTYAQVLSGAVASEFFSIQYNIPQATNCPQWSLKVRANGNFTNGINSIPAQYVSLRFNRVSAGAPSASAIGVSNSAVPLNTSDVTLINHSNAPFVAPPDYFTEHKLDMIIQGGMHLAVGAGTYSTTLTFSLYNQTGQLVSTQNLVASFIVNFSNTCSGAALTAFSTGGPTFSTYAQQMAGATINQAVTVQYAPNAATCIGWSLKVHTTGSFTNGTNSIAPQYVALRFNSVSTGAPTAAAIGISSSPVPLSTADVALIAQSNAPFQPFLATEHKFDMMVQGGIHLLVPNGTYSTNLVFSLYNSSNQLVSTSTATAYFQINTAGNTSFTVALQNGGNIANLAFSNISNYANGVILNQLKALKITGFAGYQVIVKSTNDNLVSVTTIKTIPVSAIYMQPASTTAAVPAITYSTVSLSSTDQLVISNPMTDFHYQIVEYDLKYYTQPADQRFALPAGTYTTNVIFVVIPQ